MGDQPRVSVIMPTNRGGPYLQDAVASVRAQTRSVAEIILIDDGSPEPGLESVADALGIRYVRQHASGLSVARNTGVAHAHGEWVAFLDDDDVWHPDRIAAQLAAAQAQPGAIAVSTGGWYMGADGVATGAGWGAPAAASIDMLAGRVDTPRITTLLIRAQAYRDAGGCRRALEPSEDNDLILRLIQLGEVAAVDERLVGYRRHDANVTRRGLRGRVAASASLGVLCGEAARRGDTAVEELLEANRAAFRRRAAADNLGELITAIRAREWGFAAALSRWALCHPVDSARAVALRALPAG